MVCCVSSDSEIAQFMFVKGERYGLSCVDYGEMQLLHCCG